MPAIPAGTEKQKRAEGSKGSSSRGKQAEQSKESRAKENRQGREKESRETREQAGEEQQERVFKIIQPFGGCSLLFAGLKILKAWSYCGPRLCVGVKIYSK